MFPQYPPLEVTLSWSSWFTVKNVTNVSFVQDTVHLGVKLKARLLTYSQVLPLGKYSAQSSHLKLLQASFCIEQHNLHAKDLDHQDRQNFEAVLRVTSDNVITHTMTQKDGNKEVLHRCTKCSKCSIYIYLTTSWHAHSTFLVAH